MTASLMVESSTLQEDKTISVITLAFSADPIVRWAYPDPHQYFTHFPAFVRAFAGKAFGLGTAFHTDDYAGVAMWLPPGVHPDEEPLTHLVEQTVPEGLQKPLFEMLEQQEAYHPNEPHWYLPLIGVDPSRQRQGHGSRLLRSMLSLCDSDQKLAYLEATSIDSKALYERLGFEVITTIQVAGSPPMWPMLRRPR